MTKSVLVRAAIALGLFQGGSGLLAQLVPAHVQAHLSNLDSRSAPIPANSAATLLAITVDPAANGGDQLDIVASDPNVTISLILPNGSEVTAANAIALGYRYTAFSVLGDPGVLAGTLYARFGFHALIDFPAGQPAGTYNIKANAASVATNTGMLVTYLSSSNVSSGLIFDTPAHRVGDTVVLSGLPDPGAPQ